jgi:hypothetical protein
MTIHSPGLRRMRGMRVHQRPTDPHGLGSKAAVDFAMCMPTMAAKSPPSLFADELIEQPSQTSGCGAVRVGRTVTATRWASE